jgi:uncharacterized membrane protein
MSDISGHTGRFYRFVLGRRRLLSAAAAGLFLFFVLPGFMREPTRLLVAWDFATFLYVGMTFRMISRSTVETCRELAALYDEGERFILLVVIVSASASFVAIFAELATVRSNGEGFVECLVVAGTTVVLSWTFTHLVFTLHYANVYYKPDDDGPGGLRFPGDREPDYHDFLYYSFVIGCAAQTGDVATLSRRMRQLSLVHGVVAFTFNSAILALMINVGASLL